MTIVFDTSVLVPALLVKHPNHESAGRWLRSAKIGEHRCVVAAHSLAEVYSNLTGLPYSPRISPPLALEFIQESILSHADVVGLTPQEYVSVLGQMAKLGVAGGAIYDALIAFAAQKAKADKLLTFNIDHFKRVWPEGAERIAAP